MTKQSDEEWSAGMIALRNGRIVDIDGTTHTKGGYICDMTGHFIIGSSPIGNFLNGSITIIHGSMESEDVPYKPEDDK